MNPCITETTPAMLKALSYLPRMDSLEARAMLLAIGLQESRLALRCQISPKAPGGRGPARGLLQFERLGGVRGVLNHASTKADALRICGLRGVATAPMAVWLALEVDDVLAFAFGRLLLYSDPQRLPALGDADGAWALYLRTWRPGKPHPDRWPDNYAQALKAVRGG